MKSMMGLLSDDLPLKALCYSVGLKMHVYENYISFKVHSIILHILKVAKFSVDAFGFLKLVVS